MHYWDVANEFRDVRREGLLLSPCGCAYASQGTFTEDMKNDDGPSWMECHGCGATWDGDHAWMDEED